MKFWRTFFLLIGALCGTSAISYLVADKIVVDKKTFLIISAAICVGCFLLGLIFAVLVGRANKKRKNLTVGLQKNDTILQNGIEYVVKKRGTVRPGEYTLLATDEDNKTFTLRVNDYVKEYSHNTALILSEGDRISARSSNVILR